MKDEFIAFIYHWWEYVIPIGSLCDLQDSGDKLKKEINNNFPDSDWEMYRSISRHHYKECLIYIATNDSSLATFIKLQYMVI